MPRSCAGDACPYDRHASGVSIQSALHKTCRPCAAVSFFWKTMQVKDDRDRRMAPDIAATGLFSYRRQERYSSANRLAQPVNNLKPASTDNSETPRFYGAFLLASTCACRQECRRFPSAPHHTACIFSFLERRRQEHSRRSVTGDVDACSIRLVGVCADVRGNVRATSCDVRSPPCRTPHRTRGNPSDQHAEAGRGAAACQTF
jgi:hypothetical protein